MRLIVIGVLLVVFIIVAIIRPLTGHGKAVISSLLLVAMIGGLGFMEYRWQGLETTLSAATAKVSGKDDLKAHCQRLSESLVQPSEDDSELSSDGNTVIVSYKPCETLLKFKGSDKTVYTDELGSAFYALTLQAVTANGEGGTKPTGATQCLAVQKIAPAAEQFGANGNQAYSIALNYYTNVYLKSDGASPDCREGGALDGSPGDGQFFD